MRSSECRRRSTPARSGDSPATTTSSRWRPATSPPASHGPATSPRSWPTTRTSSGTIPEKGGIIWTDNMLIPTGGSVPTASTYMNFVYDPKIAAQIAVGTSYISSVKGVKEEAVKIDPDLGEQPADLPGRRHALAGALQRPGDGQQRRLHHEVAARSRASRATPRWAASSTGIRASRPYLLLAPGDPLARDLLPRPARVPRLPVAPVGDLPDLRVHLGVLELLGGDLRLPRAAHPLVHLRGDRDGRLPPARVPARVLDRVPGRAVAQPLPPLHHRAVLRHVPRSGRSRG